LPSNELHNKFNQYPSLKKYRPISAYFFEFDIIVHHKRFSFDLRQKNNLMDYLFELTGSKLRKNLLKRQDRVKMRLVITKNKESYFLKL